MKIKVILRDEEEEGNGGEGEGEVEGTEEVEGKEEGGDREREGERFNTSWPQLSDLSSEARRPTRQLGHLGGRITITFLHPFSFPLLIHSFFLLLNILFRSFLHPLSSFPLSHLPLHVFCLHSGDLTQAPLHPPMLPPSSLSPSPPPSSILFPFDSHSLPFPLPSFPPPLLRLLPLLLLPSRPSICFIRGCCLDTSLLRAGGYEVHAARFFAWWNVVSNGGRGEGTGAAGDLFMVCMGRARRGVAARGRRLAAVGGWWVRWCGARLSPSGSVG